MLYSWSTTHSQVVVCRVTWQPALATYRIAKAPSHCRNFGTVRSPVISQLSRFVEDYDVCQILGYFISPA